ncbi:hypothetical protein TWF718_009106 [Orbilia javanica]|uniref:Uncharacterized protein n=1 Tax=Orbilia javanica TaxID=47235 RepID=A0AAN8RM98_9PEZI
MPPFWKRKDSKAKQNLRLSYDPPDEKMNNVGSKSGVLPSTPDAEERPRLIVGIDFGTTYSGVSFAYIKSGKNPEDVEIRQIHNWPRSGNQGFHGRKVPSEIGLSRHNGGPVEDWGFQIPDDCDIFRWMKILLEPSGVSQSYLESPSVQETMLLLGRHGLTPVELVSRYLKLIWECAIKEIISQKTKPLFDNSEKTVVLSVPGGWSEQATQNTYDAAVAAFQGQGIDCKRNLKLINEPAAAAIYVLNKEKKEQLGLINKDDCIIVCDAGGGTADVVTYQIAEIDPHLVLKEKVAPKGSLCGSVYLDKGFEAILPLKLGMPRGGNRDEAVENARKILTKHFNEKLKIEFDEEDRSRVFSVPIYPEIRDPDQPENMTRKIKFSYDTIRTIFDPICCQIAGLIHDQIGGLRRLGLRDQLKGVILVGGLGRSKYLRSFLEKSLGVHNLRTIGEEEGLASVTKGAVLAEAIGIPSVFSIFVARHNIGIRTSTRLTDIPSENHKRIAEYRFIESTTGEDSVRTVTWVVMKGSEIRNNTTKDIGFSYRLTRSSFDSMDPDTSIPCELVLCDEETPPGYPVEGKVRKFVKVEFRVNKKYIKQSPLCKMLPKRGDTQSHYYEFAFKLAVKWGLSNLEFSFKIDGNVVVEQPSNVSYGEEGGIHY